MDDSRIALSARRAPVLRAPPFDLSHGDARLPDWLATLPRQPTVYASLGTTFNRSPDTFQAILAALSAEPST